MNLLLAEWIGTFFKVGKLPFFPGTWGSLAAALIWFFIFPLFPFYIHLLIIAVVFFLGVTAANLLVQGKTDQDPSEIVIDEIAGQWIAYLGLSFTLSNAAAGFIIFRLIDILKPPLVREHEKWPGGWGIMADDAAAGLLTFAILYSYKLLTS
ncbi:MAG: phosphatidylglycerophosphatase A [Candidatus Neomarinimicrobiota bacterium]